MSKKTKSKTSRILSQKMSRESKKLANETTLRDGPVLSEPPKKPRHFDNIMNTMSGEAIPCEIIGVPSESIVNGTKRSPSKTNPDLKKLHINGLLTKTRDLLIVIAKESRYSNLKETVSLIESIQSLEANLQDRPK